MHFGKQNKFVGWWYSWPSIVIYTLCALLLARSVFERYQVEREMAARTMAAQNDLSVLEERAQVLETRVEYLEGARGVEEEIRKNFDVAKQGEQVVILQGKSKVNEEKELPEDESRTPWYVFWR